MDHFDHKKYIRDPFLSVSEAAMLLGLKISTVYGLCHQRKIPYRKHGRRTVFDQSDLLKWSKSNEIRTLEDSTQLKILDKLAPSNGRVNRS